MNNFLFPIETIARELDHKILMGILISNPDNKVYVGDQQIIRTLSYFVKKGVFYGKHLFGKPMFSDTDYYNRLKKNDINIVHLNEEGAVWPGGEDVWKYLLDQSERPAVLNDKDTMLTWGEWQANYNKSREDHSVKIKATGHPRFDLYNEKYIDYFKDDIDDILSSYSDYILINTAFSYSNNGEGGVDFIFKPTLSYSPKNNEHRIYRFKRWRQQMFSIADVVDLVNKLSLDFPDEIFVIRPHPSEDTNYYKSIFNGIDNVKVVYDGSVTPWVLGCKCLIHNGCTTAIEATLAGIPVLNYATNPNPDFDTYLANICGRTVDNYNDAKQFLINLDEEKASLPQASKAQDLFHNFKGGQAQEQVVDELNIAAAHSHGAKSKSPSSIKLKYISYLHKVYLLTKYTYLSFQGKFGKFVDYRKRFSGFEKNDIETKVEKLSKIVGKQVKVKYISKHLFVIEAEND